MFDKLYKTAALVNLNIKNKNMFFSVRSRNINFNLVKILAQENLIDYYYVKEEYLNIKLNQLAILNKIQLKPLKRYVSLESLKKNRKHSVFWRSQ